MYCIYKDSYLIKQYLLELPTDVTKGPLISYAQHHVAKQNESGQKKHKWV